MNFFLWGSSYRCIIIKYMLHPTSKPTLVLKLMDEKKKCPDSPNNWAYYPHIIILAIQLQQRNLEPLRLDSTRPTCMYLSNKYSQNVSAGNPTPRESHPRWHSCMCKKKVETAQDRGRSFLPIDCHDGHVSEKISSGSGLYVKVTRTYFLST